MPMLFWVPVKNRVNQNIYSFLKLPTFCNVCHTKEHASLNLIKNKSEPDPTEHCGARVVFETNILRKCQH